MFVPADDQYAIDLAVYLDQLRNLHLPSLHVILELAD